MKVQNLTNEQIKAMSIEELKSALIFIKMIKSGILSWHIHGVILLDMLLKDISNR